MLFCKFCNKECKNKISQAQHQRLCKDNPDRQTTYLMDNREKLKKSNGYIKAKEHGTTYEISDECRKKLSDAILNRDKEFLKEVGKKISEVINKKVEEGSWHTSLAKNMHITYKGYDFHGTWEVKYAQYLDSLNINWIRNTKSFKYEFEGKIRRYTPDFYLIDKNTYVEIKGYKTSKDEAKWSQFPKSENLLILMKKELKKIINIK